MTPSEFALLMENELNANEERKGKWEEWHPTVAQAADELDHHQAKLYAALDNRDAIHVLEFAADVANIAMKIAETFGGKP
jgi:hypothetical protein